jgi:trk system potassium uptake protein TrkH
MAVPHSIKPDKQALQLSPPAILSLGFLFLIVLGTSLLALPIASHQPISLLQAAFTATSAVTVTGLTVVDTANYTLFGHMVIIGLVQFGGLGFMTFAILVLTTLQGKMGMSGALTAQEAMGGTSLSQVVHTAKAVIKIALSIELVGFIALVLCLAPLKGLSQAVYEAFFLCISSFNNAGFALTGDSLMPYVNTPLISTVISGLVVMGGLGFLVVLDVLKRRQWRSFSTNTKVMLTGTVVVNAIAFGLYWLIERNNAATIGEFELMEQLAAAWFMAVTTRSSGFNNMDIAQLDNASTLLTYFLMFIGAGSMSTGGGIKLGTFMIILATTWSYLRQRQQVILFGKAMPDKLVKKSFALMSISMLMVLVSAFLLSLTEPKGEIVDILFEVISASSTVGLSRNFTAHLTENGQLIIMFLMFMGRVGPLTLAYFIATPKPTRIRYPESHTLVG